MTAKEFLQRAYRIDQRIRSKAEQIESLNEIATRCTAALTGMPRNPSPSLSPMADAVCKIIDLQSEIEVEIKKMIDIKREVSNLIDQVSDTDCQMVLEKRYLCFYTWERIATDLSFSVHYIYQIHNKALKICDKLLKLDT
jgi:hypothetical protein